LNLVTGSKIGCNRSDDDAGGDDDDDDDDETLEIWGSYTDDDQNEKVLLISSAPINVTNCTKKHRHTNSTMKNKSNTAVATTQAVSCKNVLSILSLKNQGLSQPRFYQFKK
jgi:hypothetical protein